MHRNGYGMGTRCENSDEALGSSECWMLSRNINAQRYPRDSLTYFPNQDSISGMPAARPTSDDDSPQDVGIRLRPDNFFSVHPHIS